MASEAAISRPLRSLGAVSVRRKLQLALASLWLLDGILQCQPSMFRTGFPQMLAGSAHGNPAPVAASITWSANIIGHHLALTNTAFAMIQMALGLGIAFRGTVKVALAASVVWATAVWWFGEGLGGVLSAVGASPLTGAPGAAILYALLAVVLWAACVPVNRALWFILWMSEEACALLPASRAPQGISSVFASAASQRQVPGAGWIDTRLASALAGHGLAASIMLAVACGAIALSIYLPPPFATAGAVAAIALGALIWLAEAFGGIFTGYGTDPGSGPILMLIAVACWPSFRLPDGQLGSANAPTAALIDSQQVAAAEEVAG